MKINKLKGGNENMRIKIAGTIFVITLLLILSSMIPPSGAATFLKGHFPQKVLDARITDEQPKNLQSVQIPQLILKEEGSNELIDGVTYEERLSDQKNESKMAEKTQEDNLWDNKQKYNDEKLESMPAIVADENPDKGNKQKYDDRGIELIHPTVADESPNADKKQKFGQKGDINNDGSINFTDIDWFVMVNDNQWFFKEYHPDLFWRTDMNNDGVVSNEDVDLFVSSLGN